MLLPLLLLLVCSSQASHFFGTVMTYYPKNTDTTGSITVVLRYKLNFHSCSHSTTWSCSSCGTLSTPELNVVYEESNMEWCQREGIITQQVTSNAPFELVLAGGNWINNILNNIIYWRAVTLVELRTRSDTGQANRSPQTTILSAVRVPSNCQRNFSLLAFDPDGDEVRCRNGNTTLSECNPCTPPSVLTLSPSCTLSFSPTNSSNEGPYAVQLVMEDFPRQSINLTQTDGSQVVKTTNDAISQIPVQFVLRVDPVVPSCTEGLYLPKFLSPTPANGARLYTLVNQTLEISIRAEANNSMISELLFSGPHNINQTKPGTGEFTLRWTPSDAEDGESLPICFIVQALYSTSVKYHSELRCVIVTVGNSTTITTTSLPTTTQQSTTTTPDTTTTERTTAVSMATTPVTTVTTPDDMTTTIQVLEQSTTITTTSLPTTTQQSTTTTPDTTTTERTTAVSMATTPVTTVTTPDHMTTTIQVLEQSLRVRISSSFPLTEEELRGSVLQKLKDELVRYGLPSDITLRLLSSIRLEPTNTTTLAVLT